MGRLIWNYMFNADPWSNNDTGENFGNNYSYQITLTVYTVRGDL